MQIYDPAESWDGAREWKAEDRVEQPPVLSGRTRYRFRDWWRAHDGMQLLWVRRRDYRTRWWRQVEVGGKLAEAWYYLKCRLWRRYNVVVVRTESPTWTDRSEFLLPAMMQVLTDFVERERPFEHFDTAFHHDAWWSIRDLYEWWHVRRPARLERERAALHAWHEEFERLGGMTSGERDADTDTVRMLFPQDRGADVTEERRLNAAMRALDAAGESEDEAMMIRLVRLRHQLWT